MSHDPIASIERRGYNAEPSEITELGALSIGAEKLRGTIGGVYLRALVKRAKDEDARGTNGVDAVRSAHEYLYPFVLVGVTTPDVDQKLATSAADRKNRALERNRRSNFARTAEHTLRKWVESGGNLSDLAPAEVTKANLLAGIGSGSAPSPSPSPGISPQVVGALHIARLHASRMRRALNRAKPTTDAERDALVEFCDSIAQELTQRRDEVQNVRP